MGIEILCVCVCVWCYNPLVGKKGCFWGEIPYYCLSPSFDMKAQKRNRIGLFSNLLGRIFSKLNALLNRNAVENEIST